MNAAIKPITPAAERCPSYYSATLNEETDYPTLQGEVSVDVVIIGGGFTGVASAVELAERGLKVAIVESNKIGWGATGRNGGQVTGSLSGDAAMTKQMRNTLGEEVEDFIWHLRWRGHEIIKNRVQKYGIQCDLRHGHLHAAMKPSHMDELQASYAEAMERGMGDEVTLLDAAQVLLAGDVYHKLERKQLKGMIFPAMGGIVTTAPLGELAKQINPQDLAVYDCRFVLDYYRMTADGRLLFGGGANYSGRDSRDIAGELRPCIERTFPQLKGVQIDYQWSCAMGIVMNRIPQLGKLSSNVWYCQGYSGHGVATTHIMGEIMANALTGTLGHYDTFAACKHIKVPMGDVFGNPMLAAGMWYYQMLEKLR